MVKKIGIILAGVLFGLLFMEGVLRTNTAIWFAMRDPWGKSNHNATHSFRILCIGESSTFHQYPKCLEKILNEKRLNRNFVVIDGGMASVNSDFLIKRLPENIERYRPDMIIAMMGINDSHYIPSGGVVRSLSSKIKLYKLLRLLWWDLREKLARQEICKTADAGEEAASGAGVWKERNRVQYPGDRLSLMVNSLARERKVSVAKKLAAKAIEYEKFNIESYAMLSSIYENNNELDKAEKILQQFVVANPQDQSGNLRLGSFYRNHHRLSEAVAAFTEAYAHERWQLSACLELSECYREQGKYTEAERLLKDVAERSGSDTIYGALAIHYLEQGKYELSDRYFKLAEEMHASVNPVTHKNYHELIRQAKVRGIAVVVMQYPMRSIEPLKKSLNDENDIIYVDNEQVFKKAVKNARFCDYFLDQFAGDFGHCSNAGRVLMAENIAHTILVQYFHIPSSIN
jgi:tetratricopeptide (TPR) repeat protein